MEGLTKEDKLMLKQADELIETKFLNKTTKKKRNKRFGLTGWIMGWGMGHFSSLRAIKDNIRTLQSQNKLQQDQILELSHYLNITYAHVSTNRYAITNLQVQLTELNQTLIAAMEDAKFVKYTVAVITNIRIILAKLTLGVISLQQNVNPSFAFCIYICNYVLPLRCTMNFFPTASLDTLFLSTRIERHFRKAVTILFCSSHVQLQHFKNKVNTNFFSI